PHVAHGDAGVAVAAADLPSGDPSGRGPADPAVHRAGPVQHGHRGDPLAVAAQRDAPASSLALRGPSGAVQLRGVYVVAGDQPSPGDADAVLSGPDAVPVPPVHRTDRAGVV